MEFNNVLKNRRTTRSYTNKNITITQIEKILESASLAPSAKNRQPWRFYILNSNQKNHITKMLYDWEKNNRNEKTSVKGTANQISSSNIMIMIYSLNYGKADKYYKKPDYISIGCAIENMCLQATDLGLGSCIICDTLYIEQEINDYLGINNFEQIGAIILGEPIYNTPKAIKNNYKNLLLN